jgi:hypothetical protein
MAALYSSWLIKQARSSLSGSLNHSPAKLFPVPFNWHACVLSDVLSMVCQADQQMMNNLHAVASTSVSK